MTVSPEPLDDRLTYATLLVEIGELLDAEAETAGVLQDRPADPEALSLLAKIKHMRGQLTGAFACWARAHSLQPEGGGAQLRLASMLQMAQDPERGAGEFLAVGPGQLWRKPAALLDLESAFQPFVARRPDEARAACRRVAQKYLGKDEDVYRLAVLAEAWIAELSGDLGEARQILEELGHQRGFEGDTDRALALVRLYERLGGREELEKAIHVCDHLARTLHDCTFEQVTALGRLAAYCRALERFEEAALYDRLFLEAFQRRMHRLSLADAVAVAARRYVPLEKLRAARFTRREPPDAGARREEALAAAIAGDLAAARDGLEAPSSRDSLDRKYLADLTLLEGDPDAAARRYLAVLEEDPDDRRIVGWLLDRLDGGVPKVGAAKRARIAAHFSRPEVAARARELLESALRETWLRPAYWRQLAALQRLDGAAPEARRSRERAEALQEAALRRERAVGRSLSAAVYRFAGRPKGLVHELWAERRPAPGGRGGHLAEVLGNLTPELERAVRNTFVSVREYTRAKFPLQARGIDDWNYGYKVTKEDEPSGGPSAGLPSALAFLSVLLGLPIPQDVASSGAVVADAHDVLVVRAVGEAEHKVRGAYNRNLRLLLLPEDNREALARSPLVPAAVCAEIVRYVSNLDQAVDLVFGPEVWTR